jgi:hypothetical protein
MTFSTVMQTPEFAVGTWEMPEFDRFTIPEIWVLGCKFITAVNPRRPNFAIMQIFPETLVHDDVRRRMRGLGKVVGAGFIRLKPDTPEGGGLFPICTGKSESIAGEPSARSEDSEMLVKYLAFLNDQLKGV